MSLFDYRTAPTRADFLRKFGELLQLSSIPVFSWSPFSWLRRLVEDESTLFEDLGALLRTVAMARYRHHPDAPGGEWLDLEGESFYRTERKPAVFARRKVRLQDAASVGPIPIAEARAVWVGDANGAFRFTNLAPFEIPLDGSVEVEVEAEVAGENYNLPNGAVIALFTDLPGVTVSGSMQPNGSEITQQGVNRESDAAYNARLDDQWSSIGSGADDAGYRWRALSSSPEVTRAKVYSPAGGKVRIVVGGPSGQVSAPAFALAVSANTNKVTGVPDVQTLNLTTLTTPVTATLEVLAGVDPVAARTAAIVAVQKYARELDIGPRKVSADRVGKALLVDGVDDITLTSPAADFVPQPNELWVPTFDIQVVVLT